MLLEGANKSTIDIIKAIDQVDYWEFEGGALFLCNGHGINVYMIEPDQSSWINTDYFTVGDFKYDQAEIKDFKEGINSYIKDLKELDSKI